MQNLYKYDINFLLQNTSIDGEMSPPPPSHGLVAISNSAQYLVYNLHGMYG